MSVIDVTPGLYVCNGSADFPCDAIWYFDGEKATRRSKGKDCWGDEGFSADEFKDMIEQECFREFDPIDRDKIIEALAHRLNRGLISKEHYDAEMIEVQNGGT